MGYPATPMVIFCIRIFPVIREFCLVPSKKPGQLDKLMV